MNAQEHSSLCYYQLFATKVPRDVDNYFLEDTLRLLNINDLTYVSFLLKASHPDMIRNKRILSIYMENWTIFFMDNIS